MSLPWFAFNIKAYLSDTMRLTTEAHGAYLLLILDYYETEGPAPDDDFILAAIAKLPVEQWQRHRRVLERFFQIREGHWYHERIEREMLEAKLKHDASKARAQAGAEAMHAKRREKNSKTATRQKKPTQALPKALPQAVLEHSSEHAPSMHINTNTPLITEGGEAPPEGDDLGIGGPIPIDFLPGAEISDRARAAGMTVEEIDSEVRKFIGYHQTKGSLSHDWHGSFAIWIEREIAHRRRQAAPKAPPRIEVNAQPSDADIDRALDRFKRNASTWSRHLGPEPGQAGCKIKPEVLLRHGINPTTGLVMRERPILPVEKAS